MEKRKKKEYQKPEIEKVKLAIQNPILGNCHDTASSLPYGVSACNITGAECAFP